MIYRLLKKGLLLSLLLGCAVYLAAQLSPRPPALSTPRAAENPATSNEVSFQQDVEYGVQGGEKLLLDIYQPADSGSKPRPAVVLIHGGGWTSFDKSTMRGMGNFLARSGFVAVSVDYRLFHGSENRWPAQLDDVQRSVRWLRANASKYNIDANRLGAFGHSSGAQLAALLGMEDTRDNSDPALAKYSSRVQAVVDVSGPSDFLTNHDADGDAFLTNFFGGDFTKLPEVWRSASPAFNVNKSNAPFLIVHGTSDHDVPIAQAEELYDKLHQGGVPVTLIKIDEGHTFQSAEARHRLAAETLIFFDRYLVVNP
ncbi:MAG TPA: alpha/beta hydrolase [Terriglobales bacterium]|nr:alpha/beta hydrolase [Terriglobales bacterium]